MQYQSEILRFKEGNRNRHPSPEATVAAAQSGVLSDAGGQIAVLVDLIPQLPYRSREIRTLVVKTYWASSGSIVARLRRALAAANRHLVYFNNEAPAGNKCSGSITCAVFSDDEVFLGQVGAAYAFFHHTTEPHFELFPKRDRLLIPLGGTVPPVIHVSYTAMAPDSMACLATTGLVESQAREIWQQTLALGKLNPVTSRLSRDLSETDTSGSIILIKPHITERPIPRRSNRPARGFLSKRKRPQTASPSARAPESTAPQQTVGKPEGAADSAARGNTPQASTSRAAKTRPAKVQPRPSAASTSVGETTRKSGRMPTGERQAAKARGASAPISESPAASRSEDERPPNAPTAATVAPEQNTTGSEPARPKMPEIKLPTVNISLAPVRQRMARLLEERRQLRRLRREKKAERTTTVERARLRQSLRTLLPGKVEGTRSTSQRTPPSERPAVAAGVSLGVLLLVVIITVSQYLHWGGHAKAEELVTDVRAKVAEAYQTQAPEDWYEALDDIRKAVQLDPNNQEAIDLREEIEQNVDNIEDALVLNTTPLLELGTTQSPRRIVVAGDLVYLLNTATDAVVALPLAEDLASTTAENATTILRRGETYMDEVVNHLVDLAWVEPGGSYPDGAVFIYSEGGTIYIYEPTLGPGSITFQRVQGVLEAGTISALETFGERFYLVDRHKNQILMYEPVSGIYDNPRAYFGADAAPNLHNALDISIDGRIYLLMGNGDIQTYFAGSHDYSFRIANLPDPDFTPKVMTMEADPENGLIYLGDPKNDRIIVLDKRGDFVHQYRLPRGELRQVEAMAVRAEPKVLYLIADNKLYAAPLPQTP